MHKRPWLGWGLPRALTGRPGAERRFDNAALLVPQVVAMLPHPRVAVAQQHRVTLGRHLVGVSGWGQRLGSGLGSGEGSGKEEP